MSARSIILRRRRLQKSTNRATPIVLRLTLGTVALIVGLALTAIGISAAAAVGVYNYYAKDLPAPGEIAKQTSSQFKTTRIYDRTGQVLLYEIIDPQGGNRTVVPLDRIPKNCTNATVAFAQFLGMRSSGTTVRLPPCGSMISYRRTEPVRS